MLAFVVWGILLVAASAVLEARRARAGAAFNAFGPWVVRVACLLGMYFALQNALSAIRAGESSLTLPVFVWVACLIVAGFFLAVGGQRYWRNRQDSQAGRQFFWDSISLMVGLLVLQGLGAFLA